MGDHDPGGAEGGKLLLHEGQALTGLRSLRQILRDVIADADPVPGEQAENQGAGIEEEDQIPLVNDDRGQLLKKGWFFRSLTHNSDSSRGSWWTSVPSQRIRADFEVDVPRRLPARRFRTVSQGMVLTAVWMG